METLKFTNTKIQDFIDDFYKVKYTPNDEYWFCGVNDSGESVLFNIRDNKLHFITVQSNGWLRHNVYYRENNEKISEEYYEK